MTFDLLKKNNVNGLNTSTIKPLNKNESLGSLYKGKMYCYLISLKIKVPLST